MTWANHERHKTPCDDCIPCGLLIYEDGVPRLTGCGHSGPHRMIRSRWWRLLEPKVWTCLVCLFRDTGALRWWGLGGP